MSGGLIWVAESSEMVMFLLINDLAEPVRAIKRQRHAGLEQVKVSHAAKCAPARDSLRLVPHFEPWRIRRQARQYVHDKLDSQILHKT